ncbi:hypothetical protein C8Q75DRAFT_338988 [Abortiporus biennis]|nr:hypothetical protein C8Q75DRAFT_338988 [Abortiporus biennis]
MYDSGPHLSVLLRPRPYALTSGSFLLLPLLPQRQPSKPLPSEVWNIILTYVIHDYNQLEPLSSESRKIGLLLVCKSLKEVALPLYYATIQITRPSALSRFASHIFSADQKWDSIRRIPYSAPGRWVHTLDLSNMHFGLWAEACEVDSLLTRLFPLLPFLEQLLLNPSITLSRQSFHSLASHDNGRGHLRHLKELKLHSSPIADPHDDRFIEVLRGCTNLQELAIVGSSTEAVHMAMADVDDTDTDTSCVSQLHLPHLHKLSIISMHASPVMLSLLESPLPSLGHLTITPYDDMSIPGSLVPRFIATHGAKLRSLHLYAHKSWPTVLFPSPTNLLHTCTQLHHLSLENPLPNLTTCSIYPSHPLQILSIPRPNPEFLAVLESLLPKLPSLIAVRARDVRWLRRGMNAHAQEAGVQGEMREWGRRLARRGIHILDAEWKRSVE